VTAHTARRGICALAAITAMAAIAITVVAFTLPGHSPGRPFPALLIVSFTVGLFGFRESISASYVVQSLTIETITMLALIGRAALAASHPQLATRARHSPLAGGTVCCLAPGPETRPAADGLS